ncbi:lysylphosphatidylglycerol synthase transmembrane domain-containing protein [Actinoplanes sp. NPDC051851]|uniref:lysylphosphatidylglycerol synthase transmembrane domain-containing protein n=1 Tax=Actinoplanes sp. NPDC051851 TaxID=3154753 RepID=UPI003427F905
MSVMNISRRRWVGYVLLAVVLAIMVVTLRDRLPGLGALSAALRAADWRWACLAVLSGLFSQFAYAEQQRRLLSAFGVRVPRYRALAVTYVRSALSMALPAGSAASAAYAFQAYRRHGATSAVSAAVTLLSTVVTVLSLALLYAAGWSALGAFAAVVIGALLWALFRRAGSPRAAHLRLFVKVRFRRERAGAEPDRRGAASGWTGRLFRRFDVGQAIRDARDVPARTWAVALLAGAVNWLLDMGCLVLAAAACRVDVGWTRLALIYLAVQAVRQIPITPGGLGLIETSMLTALIAAGAPQATAAAVVLIYRLISFWLILPAGLAAHLTLRAGSGGGAHRDPLATAAGPGQLVDQNG